MPFPPIVLIHGAGGNAASWAPTLAAWEGATVTAVDLPGRGDRADEAPATSAAAAAAAIAPALPPGALLVGHSYGGAVGIELALAHPGRFAGLVMVASSARLRVAPAILEAVAAATAGAPFPLDFAFGADTPAATLAAYTADLARTPPAAALADWRACDGFDRRDQLARLTLPVLVVHGTADVLTVPRFQERLASSLPAAERVALDGIGHMLPWEAPAALARAVRGWWDAR